ncbi:class I SAM-dependent methyltransferase [Angustibacter sp. McL0619]|uniref:class I SAM-dependent methyltransferase n=1 Tax=Angustibacter sp. McL0619 TaxID=3415676 RepID=UPI003CF45652
MTGQRVRGAIPSPNIWGAPEVYETENRAVDPDGVIEAAMAARHDWSGQRVLDLGCGTGFHLPGFAERAASVVGVEPHGPLLLRAQARVAGLGTVQVLAGTAQAVPLAAASVDVAQARWAYFFGPGCEPGLAELARVVRPGGTAFVIDNDASRSTFGGWFRRSLPRYDPVAVQRFWTRQGWQREPLDLRWSFAARADLEAVVRIEFAPDLADELLAGHAGTEVDYAVNLWWQRF